MNVKNMYNKVCKSSHTYFLRKIEMQATYFNIFSEFRMTIPTLGNVFVLIQGVEQKEKAIYTLKTGT